MPFDKHGREIPDPRPLEVPLKYMDRPESMEDMMKRLVRGELSRAADMQDEDNFEEANDFEIEEDDEEGISPYEYFSMVAESGPDGPIPDIDEETKTAAVEAAATPAPAPTTGGTTNGSPAE